MRLIDADALKGRAIRVSTVKEHCYMKAVGTHEIDKAPTVDAVEVVRCKDCENRYPVRLRNGEVYFYKCDFHDIEVEPDDFCSSGERRTDV
jgi:hypothetical protein